MNDKVEAFLADIEALSVEQYTVLITLRALFNAANKQLEEVIKYGGLTFELDGKLIGGIFVYNKHLSIEFSLGAKFEDPTKLLEGKGKLRRHLKIVNTGDIEEKNSLSYIQQAVNNSH